MNRTDSTGKRRPIVRFAFVAGLVLAGAAVARLLTGSPSAPRHDATEGVPRPASAAENANRAASDSVAGPVETPRGRAFEIDRESAAHEWAAGDFKNTNVIRQLAHTELEYQRMVDENARILRRQLVYRKHPAADLVRGARLSGESVREIALPGLDGREVQFEIVRTDLDPSGLRGAFSGRVAGRPDSLVTLAFKGGREAFTVVSPSDGIYLQADPREPGEVIVKSIDPDTYVAGVCGTP